MALHIGVYGFFLGVYESYIGMMEKKMDATIYGLRGKAEKN